MVVRFTFAGLFLTKFCVILLFSRNGNEKFEQSKKLIKTMERNVNTDLKVSRENEIE